MTMKILVTDEGEFYYVKELKDFHTQYGFVKAADLKSKKNVVITNTGKEFFMFEPSFADLYRKIKRHAQIITPKDIGLIISTTGINKDSSVVELGSGSGALSCFLAAIAKKVVTYDIDDRSIEATKENIKMFGFKNIKVNKRDVYSGIDDKNADVVAMDLPEPWKALDSAKSALKNGGFLVSYSPHITQALRVSNEAKKKGFLPIKNVELIEREWVLEGERSRPDFKGLGHTGFLSFFRKVG